MNIKKQIKKRGLRVTASRVAIMRLFEKQRAWTAHQIHKAIDSTNLSTVYRNLQKLEEVGLIKKVHAHDNEMYYERGEGNHHDHLSCTDCPTLECIPCPTPQLPKHELEIEGVCSSCK